MYTVSGNSLHFARPGTRQRWRLFLRDQFLNLNYASPTNLAKFCLALGGGCPRLRRAWFRLATDGSDIVGLEWMDGRTGRATTSALRLNEWEGRLRRRLRRAGAGRTGGERVNKLVFLFRDRMNRTCVRARFSLPPLASCLVAPADWSASPWKVKKDRMLYRAVQHYWRWALTFGKCNVN